VRYLERSPALYQGADVLELGAGSGLPGLVVAKSGARTVRVSLDRVVIGVTGV
jgi:predicted nicotinamide N-methyase